VRRRSGPAFRPTSRDGEAAFELSRLREDLSVVGPYRPPKLKPAACNEQEHRSEARMPCELPGLAQTPFGGPEPCPKQGEELRGNPRNGKGPAIALVV
jgi:hypothetical protein